MEREATLPPGPRLPSLGQALLLLTSPRWLRAQPRRYGDVFTLRLGRFGTLVYVVDPDDIRTVFRGDPAIFHAGEANSNLLEPVLGPASVLVTDEEVHTRQRRLMMPPFHGAAVARMESDMSEIAAAEIETWPVGRPFRSVKRMRMITFEVILRIVIGVRDADRLTALRARLPAVADLDGFTMLQFIFPALRDQWPWRRFRTLQTQVNVLLFREIELCRADPNLEERTDVLAMLVRARDEGGAALTDAELRDQLMTLLMAGHETTATGMAWALERLVRNPAVLARARRAAEEGDDAYLDAVVSETLRARPVVPDVSRRLTAPVELGGFVLPAGVFVNPAINIVHHDPRRYPEPEVFDPERFLGQHPDPAVWLPFGGGNRRCLGAAFALTEMRVVLSEILRRVDLVPASRPAERTRVRHVTLSPHAGARITLASRRSEARRTPVETPHL